MLPIVCGLAPGEGLACGLGLLMGMFIGMFMSILCFGDGADCGVVVGDAVGICIPGIAFMSDCCGEADAAGVAEAVGIDMPGIFSIPVFAGDGEDVEDCIGIFIGLLMSMPFMSCFFDMDRARFFRRVVVLGFALVFRFARVFAFGLLISMPGMFCMSCPLCSARAARHATKTSASDVSKRVAILKLFLLM
jgi:hypothetical protein